MKTLIMNGDPTSTILRLIVLHYCFLARVLIYLQEKKPLHWEGFN